MPFDTLKLLSMHGKPKILLMSRVAFPSVCGLPAVTETGLFA